MYNWIAQVQKDVDTRYAKRREEGFSLPEIMVALAVFAVLAAIAIPIFLNQQNAANSADLNTELINANIVVQNERDANNGVYPNYMPDAVAKSNLRAALTYTYSDTRLEYCIKGVANGLTRYIGSGSDGKIAETACSLPNVGGAQPIDDGGGTNPPANNHNPSISSLNPSTLYARTGGETITVNGSDFLNGASVLVDGVQISATVLNGSKLTFINPGADTYRSLEIQVKNPNARTSEPASLALVNPILTTTAPAPTAITTNEASSAVDVTATAAAITCQFNATPQYLFKLINVGATDEPAGIPFLNKADAQQLSTWRTDRTVILTTTPGQKYGLQVQAQCVLEGKTGAASTWSPIKTFISQIATPVKPTVAPTVTPNPSIIDTDVTYSWPDATCPTDLKVRYAFYVGNTVAAFSLTPSYSTTSGSTATTLTVSYTYQCYTDYKASSYSAKSPTASHVIIDKPSTPASVTGLMVTENKSTSVSFAWNPVTCNIGSPSYKFQWVMREGVASSTASGPLSGTTFTTTSVSQARDYTWRVIATCVNGSLESDPSYSANSDFSTGVVAPSGAWGANTTNSRFAIANANATFTCGAGISVQYRAVKTRQDATTGIAVATAWSSSKSQNIVSNQGSYISANLEVRCAYGSITSTTNTGPTTTWIATIDTPVGIYGWQHIGNPRGERWSAVTCPTGTRASYWAYATGDYNNVLFGPYEAENFLGYDRGAYNVGNTMVNSAIKVRCISNYTQSAYSAQQYAYY